MAVHTIGVLFPAGREKDNEKTYTAIYRLNCNGTSRVSHSQSIVATMWLRVSGTSGSSAGSEPKSWRAG